MSFIEGIRATGKIDLHNLPRIMDTTFKWTQEFSNSSTGAQQITNFVINSLYDPVQGIAGTPYPPGF